MRHLLKLLDLSREEIIELLDLADKLKAEFAAVLPEYDRERVHVSDIKKAFAWFNILVSAGITEFTLPEEEEQSEE